MLGGEFRVEVDVGLSAAAIGVMLAARQQRARMGANRVEVVMVLDFIRSVQNLVAGFVPAAV